MRQHAASERGHAARRKLLDAAVELVGELGWNAVSTRGLAERADLRPGLVHYHFESLQALLREAVLRKIRMGLAEMEPIVAPEVNPTDGISTLLKALDGYTGVSPDSILIIEAYLAATRDEQLRTQLAEIVTTFADSLSSSLEAWGVRSPRSTAAVLGAALDGILLHRALHPELNSAAVTPVLHRLLTAPDQPPPNTGG